MKEKRVLVLLVLVLVSTIFPTGTAFPSIWENDTPENPGLPVLMGIEDHYEDNLIPENPGLPEVMDLEDHFGDNLIPENPELPELLDEDKLEEHEKDIIELHRKKKERCRAIEDEDERANCFDEVDAWFGHEMEKIRCQRQYHDSPSERNTCERRSLEVYQAERKYNKAKAECRAIYKKDTKQRRECMSKARKNFEYELWANKCKYKYDYNPEWVKDCREEIREECEQELGSSCLLPY